MPPRARGRGSRGSADLGPRGGGPGFRGDGRGRGGDRGRGDRGFRGERGNRGGERGGRGRGSRGAFPAARYEAVEAPAFHPDPAEAVAVPGPTIAPGVNTIGVRRPAAPGTLGQPLTVTTNNFEVTIPQATIHHYDVVIEIDNPEEKSIKWNLELIRNLQEHIAPTIFTPRAVYDGRRNIFASRRLPLANGDSQVFEVTLEPVREGRRPPKVYRVELKHVDEIEPILLQRYQQGVQSIDNRVLTAVTAVNVVVRMEPISHYPFNARSFYTDKEVRPVGYGIELWRGYFQSIRPGLRSMLVNIDISTGMMYAPGPMIGVCQQILCNDSIDALVPGHGLPDRERRKLERFLANVRFITTHKGKNGQVNAKPKVLRKITSQGANNLMFVGSDDTEISVEQYFRSLGTNLRHPRFVCIEDARGDAFPIEVCSILPGQLMRKPVPPEVTKSVLEFSTKRPDKRLNSIVAGHQVLQYGQSESVRQFEMTISQTPERCAARVLPTPPINYGRESKFRQIRPANGAWNVQFQRLFKPADVGEAWALVIYDGRNVQDSEAQELIHGLRAQADLLGIRGVNTDPHISYPSAQTMNVANDLDRAGQQVIRRTGKPPTLLVVVLPDHSADMYQAVKHFGDVFRGVPTQCISSKKIKGSRPQYWANVCLKINAKLGGINSILDPNNPNLRFISDVANPAMVLGADVMHPAPGAKDRPSFASIVGSIDLHAAHYSAVSAAQGFRVEIIADVENMVYELIGRHAWWKQNQEKKKVHFPKKIIYYRDGVSEGQFQQILDVELPGIKAACKRHRINPTITVVVVGKRHHVRFFPTHGMGDKSGNCPAGTVVDDVVGHPTEFDFYLQSHGGLLGTSRSAHYSVLHDENHFTADSLQALSFGLCHVYARATRSVSIPAPVYYADIVCERAKNHYNPSVGYHSVDETETTTSGGEQRYEDLYEHTHASMRYKMYFQ